MKHRILIIDDDDESIKILRAYLKTWDYQVEATDSGEAGLDMIRREEPDLVISDVCMPGMGGEDVLKAVKTQYSHTPVILLTAHADLKAAVRTIQNGAFDYITKPLNADELKIAVERAIHHNQLLRQNEFLVNRVQELKEGHNRLLGNSPPMVKMLNLIKRVARSDSTVLITGETGTGKEVVAQTIHNLSPRSDKPMVACNCAALNTNLLESELFGHEKGAFTGAVGARKGRFEEADLGTLYLDEISETELDFQAKLLRVIQESTLERVGSSKPIKVNVRLIASSNRNLEAYVKKGAFREDLFYRLTVVPIHVPPLRERGEDIMLLAHAFLDEYNQSFDTRLTGFTEAATHYLMNYSWPGNVRELRHAVERGVILSNGDMLDADELKPPTSEDRPEDDSDKTESLQDFQDRTTSEHLLKVLDHQNWNQVQAARELGIDRSTLYRLLKKYRLQKPEKQENPV
ncbi:MAG: sigma-54 dependent transcriptional regulator [Verrucomicrobiota bacterium]